MRKVLVPLVTAALLAVPTVAYATIDHCPAGVSAVRGTQPSYAAIDGYLVQRAAAHAVPVQLLRAVAYQESRWTQFHADGTVVVSSDPVCGLGIMQITSDTRADAVRLASDWQYNVDVGAGFLHDKWVESQGYTHAAPNGYAADDPHAIENWYYALCLYNGCHGADAYAAAVADIVADPFRYAEPALKPYLPYGGFTKPVDADASYVFPHAFQADLSPQQFVFYDDQTGDVTKTVAALTHDDRATRPSYGAGTYGPDGPGVTCGQCGGWRLAETRGVTGRAHWTYSITGVTKAWAKWQPALPRTGLYRVSAYVPAIGTDTLGTATYDLAGTPVTIDQNAARDAWRSLGDTMLSPGEAVVLGDHSTAGGQKLVADAVRFAALTKVELTASTSTVTYGHAATLTARLTHLGTTTGLPGRTVTVYKRKAGTTAWAYVGAYLTNASGAFALTVAPSVNAEYQARFTAPATDYVSSTSTVRRINVRTRVAASLSRTTVPRNVAVTVSTSVAPSHAGQGVVLQRYYGGAWHNALSKTLSASSAAAFTFAKSVAGTYTYRVYKPADADHVASWSATLTLKVT